MRQIVRREDRCERSRSPYDLFKRMAGLEPATSGVESEVRHPGWLDLGTALYHLSYILICFAPSQAVAVWLVANTHSLEHAACQL